jgi:5'-methylthioadenosine phosphorylase
MLPEKSAGRVERAKNAIPLLAVAAARKLSGKKRDCPCAVSMERYRRRGIIGADFRAWVAMPGRRGG